MRLNQVGIALVIVTALPAVLAGVLVGTSEFGWAAPVECTDIRWKPAIGKFAYKVGGKEDSADDVSALKAACKEGDALDAALRHHGFTSPKVAAGAACTGENCGGENCASINGGMVKAQDAARGGTGKDSKSSTADSAE